jgi:hypothetical protein
VPGEITEGATPENSGTSSEPPAPSEYDQAADMDPSALTDFRDALTPYGTWDDDPTYGTVWLPSSVVVGADFAPYVTNGHWGLTASSSWLWVSDFSWGWAPFHYGRWVWIGGRGWAWIPGSVYAPAWVVWRTGYYGGYGAGYGYGYGYGGYGGYGGFYIGWAPMPPTWYWYGGYPAYLGYVPPAPYVFCPSAHAFAPYLRPHVAPAGQVGFIGPQTRPYYATTPGVASTARSSINNMTRGPTMADAHVPTSSIPLQRVTPEPRAAAFAQTHPQTRSYASAQSGPLTGRGGLYDRTPGSNYTSRPSGQQVYTSRPLSPAAAPVRPSTPVMHPSSPVVPSTPRPRSYTPSPVMPQITRPTPAQDFARPAPVVRPSMPSMPSPAVRPSIPSMPSPAVRPSIPSMPSPAVRPSAPPAVQMSHPSAPSVAPSRPSR